MCLVVVTVVHYISVYYGIMHTHTRAHITIVYVCVCVCAGEFHGNIPPRNPNTRISRGVGDPDTWKITHTHTRIRPAAEGRRRCRIETYVHSLDLRARQWPSKASGANCRKLYVSDDLSLCDSIRARVYICNDVQCTHTSVGGGVRETRD